MSDTKPTKDILHFRVTDAGPNPLRSVHAEGSRGWLIEEMRLRIEPVQPPGPADNMAMPASQLAPYQEALDQAIASQAVYWVDLNYDGTWGTPSHWETRPERILKAVGNGQMVPPAAGPGSPD